MEWQRWGVCRWEWWLGLLTLTLIPWDSPSDSAVLGSHSVGLTEARELGDKSVLWLLTPRAGISYFPSLTDYHSSGGFKMGMLVPLKVLRRWAWHLAPFCCMIPQRGSKAGSSLLPITPVNQSNFMSSEGGCWPLMSRWHTVWADAVPGSSQAWLHVPIAS